MELNQHKDIYSSIEKSDTDGNIKFDIKKSISKAKSIEKKIEKNNPYLHQKFQKEYNDLENQIYKSIETENKITTGELIEIKVQMGDISKLKKKPRKININKLIDIDVSKLPSSKLESVLDYLNKKYRTYNIASDLDKLTTGTNDTLSSLSDKYEVRIFQDKLIKRIIGNNKGYNNNLLQGFNPAVGNYIVKINNFENEIGTRNSIQSLNTKGLGSYIKYLSSINKLDYSYLVEKYGEEKTDKLLILKNNFLKNNTDNNWIKGHFKRISNSITKYFSILIKGDYNSFDKKMENINKEKKEKYIKQIEKNPEDRNALIKRDLDHLLKNNFDINKNHNDILIISIELSIKEGSTKLISILKQIGWKEEKINKFLEKIKNKEFNSPKDLGIFIKELQKENPKLKAKDITQLTTSINKINSDKVILKVLVSEESEEKKQEKLKKITDTYLLNSAFLKSKTFVTSVMNVSNINNFDTILKEVIKNDEELKNTLGNLEIDYTYGNILDEYIGKNINKYINETVNELDSYLSETKTIEYENGEELTYIKNGDYYNIYDGIDGSQGINITENEFLSIKDSPENLNNLLRFKEVLSDLNLDFIWEKRHNFIKKLNNIDPTLNIKIDKKNYINETELKKILNSIITLSGNEKGKENDLDGIKLKLREISKSGLDENQNDLKGSPIEKIFIDNGIINKNSTTSYFKIDKMKEHYK